MYLSLLGPWKSFLSLSSFFFSQSWCGDFLIIHFSLFHQISLLTYKCIRGGGGGGTDLERGYEDVRPWRPLFAPLLPLARVPFQAKVSVHKTPFWENLEISLYSLNFQPNFSSQAPKFGNFQLTSPQIWKVSAHKPPNWENFRSQTPLFRGKCQFASPTLRKSGPHTPTWKKIECPPPGNACHIDSGVCFKGA